MVDLGLQRFQNQSFRGRGETASLRMPRWIALAGLLTGLVLAYAWSQLSITHINYEIENYRKKIVLLEEANSALRAEESALTNPEKIDRLAQGMGLVRSNHTEVLILEAGPAKNLLAESISPSKTVNAQ